MSITLVFSLTENSAGILQPYWARLISLILISLVGTPFVQVTFGVRNSVFALLIAILVNSIFLQIFSLLTKVSPYPFTLEWSETSRYYYASLFLGEQIYGVKTDWTVLHPSRYLLQAIPFLLPNSPLWLHRLWQVGLWIGVSGLTAYAFLRRFGRELPFCLWMIGLGWLFLYLLLGPVYYHLQLAVIPLLLWFRPNVETTATKSVSILVLVLSSLWAGLSRLNWYPVPALIAVLLYLLETPYFGNFWRYFWRPLVWTIVGVGFALTAHWGYVQLSGNPPAWFGTSLTSQLLWYRLFPNATYPMGILLASWVVIFPMGLLIYHRFTQYRTAVCSWRWIGLFGILLGLYLGGLVVSVKIGGGSNLHNLDAFWTCFGLVFIALMTQNLTPDTSLPNLSKPLMSEMFYGKRGVEAALIGTLIVPVLFLLSSLEPFFRPDWAATEKALRRLQGVIKDVPAGQDVLFISERQLLTFGYLQGVRLVPEYERVFLMEMAMANNQTYLQQFYRDLREHRFALIINEPLYITTKGKPLRFGEENDAWVERVSKPLLCYYKPIQQARMLLMGVEIQILEPRPKPAEGCP
ncbi:MAG: hypothetical protein N3D16_00640 [Anaerolineales bacterium]|nr:hypothetical protein [Anaerolineales bacterium]